MIGNRKNGKQNGGLNGGSADADDEPLSEAKATVPLLSSLRDHCSNDRTFLQLYGFKKGYVEEIIKLDELLTKRLRDIEKELAAFMKPRDSKQKKQMVSRFEEEQARFSEEFWTIENRIVEIRKRTGVAAPTEQRPSG